MNDFISPLVSIQSFESMAKCFLLIPLMNGKHLSSLVSQICPGFVLGIRPFLWDLLSIPPCPSTHPPHLQFLRCISDLEYLFFPSYLGLPCTYFDFFFFFGIWRVPFLLSLNMPFLLLGRVFVVWLEFIFLVLSSSTSMYFCCILRVSSVYHGCIDLTFRGIFKFISIEYGW